LIDRHYLQQTNQPLELLASSEDSYQV